MKWFDSALRAFAIGGCAVFLMGADAPAPTTASSPAPTAQPQALLFAYFKGNGQDGLHLASSDDGLHWTALKGDKPFLAPQVGKEKLMRDPSISRGPDGVYHAVWTCSWNDHGIGYSDSKDLIHWSDEKFIPLMEKDPGTRNCWAPELFYDKANGQYLIIWSSTVPGKFADTDGQDANPTKGDPGYNHRIYYVTTKDFKDFSPTRLLYNPGFNCIDAAIFQEGSQFVLVFKDESNAPFPVQKNLKLAFAEKAEGPYSKATDAITGNYWAEGPTPIKIGNQWYVLFDKYRNSAYGAVTSTDLRTWTDASDKISYPKGMRHGTIFSAAKADVDALKKVE